MDQFIHGTLPYILVGLVLVILVWDQHRPQRKASFIMGGMCLGLLAGLGIAMLMKQDLGLGVGIGMLLGEVLGLLVKKK